MQQNILCKEKHSICNTVLLNVVFILAINHFCKKPQIVNGGKKNCNLVQFLNNLTNWCDLSFSKGTCHKHLDIV